MGRPGPTGGSTAAGTDPEHTCRWGTCTFTRHLEPILRCCPSLLEDGPGRVFVSGRAADGHSCDEHLLLVRSVAAFCYEFYIQAPETDALSSPEASETLGSGRRSPGRRSGDVPGIFWKRVSGVTDSPRSA